jgi:hypothetical protein
MTNMKNANKARILLYVGLLTLLLLNLFYKKLFENYYESNGLGYTLEDKIIVRIFYLLGSSIKNLIVVLILFWFFLLSNTLSSLNKLSSNLHKFISISILTTIALIIINEIFKWIGLTYLYYYKVLLIPDTIRSIFAIILVPVGLVAIISTYFYISRLLVKLGYYKNNMWSYFLIIVLLWVSPIGYWILYKKINDGPTHNTQYKP